MTERRVIECELVTLKQWLSSDFGDAVEELLPLFLEPQSDRPLYLTHLPIVLHTLQVECLLDSQLDALNAAYVYLTSAFYCVDALADGHPQLERSSSVELIATALPLLISAACKRLHDAVLPSNESRSDTLVSLMQNSLLELRNATKIESEYCRTPELSPDFEKEAFHLAGRSATIIFLFKAVGYLAAVKIDEKILKCLRSILVAIQLGDDISDWRADLAAGKWTPFLRQCYERGARSLVEFERLILINNQFESALVDVGKRLAASLDGFPLDLYSPDLLRKFVDLQINRVRMEVQRTIFEKLEAGAIYEYAKS